LRGEKNTKAVASLSLTTMWRARTKNKNPPLFRAPGAAFRDAKSYNRFDQTANPVTTLVPVILLQAGTVTAVKMMAAEPVERTPEQGSEKQPGRRRAAPQVQQAQPAAAQFASHLPAPRSSHRPVSRTG
jgi:hypothetical protein